MQIIKANAEYTGGGIYRYTAQTDKGTWLIGDTLWDSIEEVDADPDATEDSWYSEWMEQHSINTYNSCPIDEYTDLMNQLIRWILDNKPDGNYDPSEIKKELNEERKNDMRRYTVKKSDFGNMPIAGYITEIMKKVVDFDGWDVLRFAKELNTYATKLDSVDYGEVFILISSDDLSACYNDFEFRITSDLGEFDRILERYEAEHGFSSFRNTMLLRLFGFDEEFGLEELEVLF